MPLRRADGRLPFLGRTQAFSRASKVPKSSSSSNFFPSLARLFFLRHDFLSLVQRLPRSNADFLLLGHCSLPFRLALTTIVLDLAAVRGCLAWDKRLSASPKVPRVSILKRIRLVRGCFPGLIYPIVRLQRDYRERLSIQALANRA